MKKLEGMVPPTLVFEADGQKGDFGPPPSSSIEVGMIREFAILVGGVPSILDADGIRISNAAALKNQGANVR